MAVKERERRELYKWKKTLNVVANEIKTFVQGKQLFMTTCQMFRLATFERLNRSINLVNCSEREVLKFF